MTTSGTHRLALMKLMPLQSTWLSDKWLGIPQTHYVTKYTALCVFTETVHVSSYFLTPLQRDELWLFILPLHRLELLKWNEWINIGVVGAWGKTSTQQTSDGPALVKPLSWTNPPIGFLTPLLLLFWPPATYAQWKLSCLIPQSHITTANSNIKKSRVIRRWVCLVHCFNSSLSACPGFSISRPFQITLLPFSGISFSHLFCIFLVKSFHTSHV